MVLALISFLFLLPQSAHGAKAKDVFPRVRALHGQVQASPNGEGQLHDLRTPVKDGGSYKEIHTGEKSWLRVELAPDFDLSAFENVKLEFSSAKEIHLHSGKLRLRLQSGTLKEPVRVFTRSTVAEFATGDYVISYNEKTGEFFMQNLRGESLLRGSGREDFTSLKGSSQISFYTQLEDGEPVFDMMTHGKKIVRGEFSKVVGLQGEQLKNLDLETTLKMDPVKKKVVAHVDPNAVCLKPSAQFNQCLFVAEKGGTCTRKRCNAQGKWADEIRLPASYGQACGKNPRVGRCDY
ncbi:MAG: hypothetical protein AB7H97_16285 [Pseudobdellovibrionaceae bacterium]